jgi:hypothetical protein
MAMSPLEQDRSYRHLITDAPAVPPNSADRMLLRSDSVVLTIEGFMGSLGIGRSATSLGITSNLTAKSKGPGKTGGAGGDRRRPASSKHSASVSDYAHERHIMGYLLTSRGSRRTAAGGSAPLSCPQRPRLSPKRSKGRPGLGSGSNGSNGYSKMTYAEAVTEGAQGDVDLRQLSSPARPVVSPQQLPKWPGMAPFLAGDAPEPCRALDCDTCQSQSDAKHATPTALSDIDAKNRAAAPGAARAASGVACVVSPCNAAVVSPSHTPAHTPLLSFMTGTSLFGSGDGMEPANCLAMDAPVANGGALGGMAGGVGARETAAGAVTADIGARAGAGTPAHLHRGCTQVHLSTPI